METHAQIPPGEVLDGRYRVDELIAVGGMGAVYRGTHLLLHKRIAIKVLRSDMRDMDQMVERFQREAIAASAIGHENIVAVHDMGTTSAGVAYLVMELLEGQNLGDLIEAEAPLDVAAACDIALEILSGIAAAHHAGIVHRDLKPDNIFMAQRQFGRDRAKILDFGVSRLTSVAHATPDVRLTTTGMIMGTPSYMSPEQARGDLRVDHLTDIYASGVILYEMLANQRPYGVHNYNVLVHKILSAETVPLTEYRPELPPELVAAIERAMALSPVDRFSTAEAFAIAIAPFSSDPKAAPELPVTLPRARRSSASGGYGPSAVAATVAGTPQPRTPESKPPPVTAKAPVAKAAPAIPPGRPTIPETPRSRGTSAPPPKAQPNPSNATIALSPDDLIEPSVPPRPASPSRPAAPPARPPASTPPAPAASTSFASEDREPQRPRSSDARAFRIGIGVTVAVVGAGALLLFLKSGGGGKKATEEATPAASLPAGAQKTPPEPTTPQPPVDEAPVASVPATPATPATPTGHSGSKVSASAPGMVTITFQVTPRDATITIDGAQLSGTVYRTHREDTAAFVRIEAPGYRPHVAPLSLDSDDTVVVALKPEEKPAEDKPPVEEKPPEEKPPEEQKPAEEKPPEPPATAPATPP